MQHHGGAQEHRGEGLDRARVGNPGVVRPRGNAKAILLQAYLECLNAVCHHKQQRESNPGARVQAQIVKMLTAKTKALAVEYREAYGFCLDLWDDDGLSSALLVGSSGEEDRGDCKERCGDGSLRLPVAPEMAAMKGHEVVLRLALLADFYRYLAGFAPGRDVLCSKVGCDQKRGL
ncbi:Hypothetical protein SMAX5B_007040 [Scophthalmus maximus]|uniref:Uncharacterized protein n=1 Tax=Scophthalmus maximus TaxID=52904 RepID=A0A2U9B3C7_SCOMX|nr:Hypothetical protein SMAX5B_007040 [Scophthalmus maximus]KAF0022099.1 hypothetical protein F2P81_025644 [Scophthalmus maximus]KAF0023418.1 hypothetical protein F2P81_024048 [Scophthalmus maximus]